MNITKEGDDTKYTLPQHIKEVVYTLINKQLEYHNTKLEDLSLEDLKNKDLPYYHKYTITAKQWQEWIDWAINWVKLNVNVPNIYRSKYDDKYANLVKQIDFNNGLKILDPENLIIK